VSPARELSAPAARALAGVARTAWKHAHAPYSGFQVGAAVRTRRGRVFAGCNVENASLGAGICAERGAIMQAVAAGMRPGELRAVAVYTRATQPTPPCGVCLQFLVEFGRDVEILLAGPKGIVRRRLSDLLPEHFTDFPRRRRR